MNNEQKEMLNMPLVDLLERANYLMYQDIKYGQPKHKIEYRLDGTVVVTQEVVVYLEEKDE